MQKKMFFLELCLSVVLLYTCQACTATQEEAIGPIPWLLHGDGAPFSEVDSLMVLSMRCAISHHSIKVSQLLLAALPKTAKYKILTETNLGSYCWKFQEIGRQEEGGFVCAGRRPGILFFRVWMANSHEQLPLPFLQGRQFFRHDKDQAPLHRFQEKCIVEDNPQKLG